ncbi:MAG: S8 family serine peptidase, partial [Candidatus Aenigmarchaeota archaeon]|nr:S8 family serine peptidase [Candidatus Aenigmarchaeota archaeon]
MSSKSRIVEALAVILIIAALFLVNNNNFTGLAAYEETYSININETIDSNSPLLLTLQGSASTLKLSGLAFGIGNYAVMLVSEDGQFVIANGTVEENSTIELSNVCVETCSLENITANIAIRVTGEALVNVSEITYALAKKLDELKWNLSTNRFAITAGESIKINLSELILPADANVTFGATQTGRLSVLLDTNILNITPELDFAGRRIVGILATDGVQAIRSELIIDVSPAENISVPEIDDDVVAALAAEPEVDVIIVLKQANISIGGRSKLVEQKLQTRILRDALLENLTAPRAGRYGEFDYNVTRAYETLPVVAGTLTQQGLDKLRQNPVVAQVIPDDVFSIARTEALPLINSTAAYAPLNYTPQMPLNLTGSGLTACLLDTGVDKTHPELAGAIVEGFDFVNNDANATDDAVDSHGTHVAGILHSAAPNATLMPLKVCDSAGKCKLSNVLAGIDYCMNASTALNISVISASISDHGEYNSTTCPTFIDGVLQAVASANTTFVSASGNDMHTNGISYPACSPYTIAVGASTKQDMIAPFSNTGELLDVLAPGVDIQSTAINGGYATLSGTSVATPFVAGAVMLRQEANGRKSVETVRESLRTTGRNISGFMRLDAAEFIGIVNLTPQSTNTTLPPITNTTYAKIEFKQQVDLTNFTACSNLSYNHAEINSTSCPEYNLSARIWFYNLPFVDNLTALRDGVPCSANICENLTLNGSNIFIDVKEFSAYSINGSEQILSTEFVHGQSFSVASTANVTFNGSAGDLMITAANGDWNNDGVDDIIIGSLGADVQGLTDNGQLGIFFGPRAQGQSFKLASANVTFNGSVGSDFAGIDADAGDFNNDNNTDVIIGWDEAKGNAGQAFIFFGPFAQGKSIVLSNANANISFNGSATMKLGSGVGFGDMNNDGIDDALVGANKNLLGGGDGQIGVWFGPFTHGKSFTDTTANVTFNATVANDQMSRGIASGKLDSDAIDDIVIGSNLADVAGITNNGQIMIYFGPFSQGQSFLRTQANVTFNGSADTDRAGEGIDVGDFNNDGLSDVGIGAFLADPQGLSGAGQAYVFFGTFAQGQSFKLASANVTFNGSAAGDSFGWGVSNGDFNDDGLDDIALVAELAAPAGAVDAGQTYVFFQDPAHITQLILNSTTGINNSFENLTATPINITGNNPTINYNWLVNGTSWTVLNMPMTAPFNNGSRNLTFDFSGLNNLGVLGTGSTAPAFNTTGGIVGGAYEFDGSDDFIDFGNAGNLNLSARMTIEAWVNVKNLSGGANMIVSKWNGAGNQRQFVLYKDGNKKFAFDVSSTGTTISADRVSLTTATTGTLFHVVGVYDGPTSTLDIYVNGVKDNGALTGTVPSGLFNSTANVRVGSEIGGFFFNGTIDEVKIYNRTLSAEQILAIYNNSKPRYDRIIQNETGAVGENWTAVAVPIDSAGLNGTQTFSNNLTIMAAVALNITATGCRPSSLFANQSTVCNATVSGGTPGYTVNANVTLPNTTVINQVITNISTNFTFNFTANFNIKGLYNVSWFVNDTAAGTATAVDNFTINNTAPTIASVILNSTTGANTTNENLTAYPQNIADADGDNVSVNYNWLINGTSWTVLNMPMTAPFNNGSRNLTFDFSGLGSTGSLGNTTANSAPLFNATGIYGGAYEFDGLNDIIFLGDKPQFDIRTSDWTVTAWVKSKKTLTRQDIIGYTNAAGSNDFWHLSIDNADKAWFRYSSDSQTT